jgi:hypothetical protein
MEKENNDVNPVIACAIEQRDRGMDGGKLIRTCLFLAVLFAYDEDLDVKYLIRVLERMFDKTKMALSVKDGFIVDDVGEA